MKLANNADVLAASIEAHLSGQDRVTVHVGYVLGRIQHRLMDGGIEEGHLNEYITWATSSEDAEHYRTYHAHYFGEDYAKAKADYLERVAGGGIHYLNNGTSVYYTPAPVPSTGADSHLG